MEGKETLTKRMYPTIEMLRYLPESRVYEMQLINKFFYQRIIPNAIQQVSVDNDSCIIISDHRKAFSLGAISVATEPIVIMSKERGYAGEYHEYDPKTYKVILDASKHQFPWEKDLDLHFQYIQKISPTKFFINPLKDDTFI